MDFTVLKVQLYKEAASGRAILVGKPDQNEIEVSNYKVWIPNSLINHSALDGEGSTGEIEIPEWLYNKHEDALQCCLVD